MGDLREAIGNVKEQVASMRDKAAAIQDKAEQAVENAKEQAAAIQDKVEGAVADVKDTIADAKEAVADAKESITEVAEEVRGTVKDAGERARETIEVIKEEVQEKIEDVKEDVEKAKKAIKDAGEKAKETVEKAKETVEKAKEAVEKKIEEVKETVEKAKEKVDEAREKFEEIKNEVKDKIEEGKQKFQEAKEKVKEEIKKAKETVQKGIETVKSILNGEQEDPIGYILDQTIGAIDDTIESIEKAEEALKDAEEIAEAIPEEIPEAIPEEISEERTIEKISEEKEPPAEEKPPPDAEEGVVSGPLVLRIESPLGGELVLNELEGTEEISRPFSFTLVCHSKNAALDPTAIVGKDVAFAVQSHDGTWRDFHGIAVGFTPLHDGSGQPLYRVRVAPWLWCLGLASDNRIYQDKDVKEILADLFERHGVSQDRYDFSNLSKTYEKREYCIQYGETSLNFVSRLLEDEGIFYWFAYESTKHVLMLGDSADAYQQAADAEVAYRNDPQNASGEALITAWEREHSFTSHKFTVSDHDYNEPTINLENSVALSGGCEPVQNLELYHFPAMRKTSDAAKARVESVKNAHVAATDVAVGEGCCRSFSPGSFFTLGDAPYPSDQGDYVLTSVRHKAHGGRQKVGVDTHSHPIYTNSFTCVPKNRVVSPLKQTPVPKVSGVETAVVTGPEGEEVYTDKLGRVKVRFMWDRSETEDDQSSCWLRVMHSHVGGLAVPRIGHEVAVSFEHGSPDRPAVAGAVYNAIKNIHDDNAFQSQLEIMKSISDEFQDINDDSVMSKL